MISRYLAEQGPLPQRRSKAEKAIFLAVVPEETNLLFIDWLASKPPHQVQPFHELARAASECFALAWVLISVLGPSEDLVAESGLFSGVEAKASSKTGSSAWRGEFAAGSKPEVGSVYVKELRFQLGISWVLALAGSGLLT